MTRRRTRVGFVDSGETTGVFGHRLTVASVRMADVGGREEGSQGEVRFLPPGEVLQGGGSSEGG